MAKRILQKVSFGMTRTNPKLTTNIKVVVDSKDKIFLESFDEAEELSDARFKGFKVSGGSYSQDLFNFYDKGKFPKAIAYSPVIKDDSLSVKSKFREQYDMTYSAGAYPKISKLYNEEFAVFAPLWLEPLNIPDYFVIFKNPNPIGYAAGATSIDDNFYKNIVESSKIHAIIDLTENTNIGRYIRRHVKDELFPEAPININFVKNEFTTWNGISFDRGEMTEKKAFMYEDLLIRDKTIMEMENLITNGFQTNGIVCANILNMEFLFDDVDAKNYEINRYFGFYCNAEEIGKFKLDGAALFADRINEATQLPRPEFNTIGYIDNIESQIQTNENGIKIYLDKQSGIIPKDEYFDNIPRFGFVKDKTGKLYSLKNGGLWADNTQLRIDDKTVNWESFTGFAKPIDSIDAFRPKDYGRPYAIIDITNNPFSGDQIRVKEIYSTLSDYNLNKDSVLSHTVTASSGLLAGAVSGRTYSLNGTKEQVAIALRKALNNIIKLDGDREIFRAVEVGTKVIVYSRFVNTIWNKIEIQSYKLNSSDTINIFGANGKAIYATAASANYSTAYPPPSTSALVIATTGFVAKTNFTGGTDSKENYIVVNSEDIDVLTTNRYLKTQTGWSKIKSVNHYLDNPSFGPLGSDIIKLNDFDKYRVVQIEDADQVISLNSGRKITLYETVENGTGFLSMYPVKDFDFDFHNDDYTRDVDADPAKLLAYQGATASIGSTALSVVNELIGPTSQFITSGGFIKLAGDIDELSGEMSLNDVNEYDRLNENINLNLSIQSRIIPFINKWVYDDQGKDVRENDYRFDVSEAFRYSNFSPSFKAFNQNPKFYTHEWYYLQNYPAYMTTDLEKKNAYSYFDSELDLDDLYDITDDKFLEYFTQDKAGTVEFPTKFKYSIFSGGDNANFAETFFRGVKVKIAERSDISQKINFNINEIITEETDKFNDYKFSAVLVFDDVSNLRYRFIKNDTFKHITLVIGIGFDDELFEPTTGATAGSTPSRYFDRTMLYTLKDKYNKNYFVTGAGSQYSTIDVSGSLELYGSIGSPITTDSQSHYKIIDSLSPYYGLMEIPGIIRIDGSIPNFSNDINISAGGEFGDITIKIGTKDLVYGGIKKVSTNSIICKTITWDGSDITSATWTGGYPSSATIATASAPTYPGGFNAHKRMMNNISFASIADKINSGDPIIEYWDVDSTGATGVAVKSETYLIELLKPEQENKVTTFGSIEDFNRPTTFSTTSDSIGSTLKFLDRTYVAPITRYNGNYTPRFKDVLFYKNDITTLKPGLINQGIVSAKVDGIIDNVTFDTVAEGFAKIKNMYHNKVNENNPKGLLELTRIDGFNPVYPKINEIAINYLDFDTTLSNWSNDYFLRYSDKATFEKIKGTHSMLEKRSFYGSKIMNLPETIELESFNDIDINDSKIGGRELFLPSDLDFDIVSRIQNTGENTTVSGNTGRTNNASNTLAFNNSPTVELWVYIEKALEKYLIGDNISSVFTTFVPPLLSTGLKDTIDDDVKSYIKQNILKVYSIDTIELSELRYRNNTNSFKLLELGLNDTDRRIYSFQNTRNFRTQNLTNSNLNFKLIYNIPEEKKLTSISLKVLLRKK